MSSNPTETQDTVVSRFRMAFEVTQPEMRALPDAELVHINVDVAAAVTTALGAWPEIKASREQIARKLVGFDLPGFDKLETYALATGHAHALYTVAQGPSTSVAELADRGLEMREQLWSDANALARRGLLDHGRIKELRSTTGYRNIAFDLLGLVAVMRERWSKVVGKTAITLAELGAAEQLADRLISEVGQREQGPVAIATATLDRQRAFTLFVRTYDQARRALSYLRWKDGDVDQIAPSLYAGRNRRRAQEPESDLPIAPAATPAPATPVATPAAPTTAAFSAIGLPTSSPFTK